MNFANSISLATAICLTLAAERSCLADEPVDDSLIRLTDDGWFKQRPSWSPDGKLLAFSRHKRNQISIWLLEADSKEQRRLTKRTEPEFDAVWHPNGKQLFFAFDKTSPNQGDIEVHSIGLDGMNFKPIATSSGKLSHEESPACSADGKWIAFTSTREGNQELYIAKTDGKDVKRLTSDPAIDAHPCFSPDSKRIVFASNRWGDLELAIIDIDGSNLKRMTHSPGLDDYPVWSPDGKQIAWTSNRDRNFEIYTSLANGDNPTNFSRRKGIDNFPAYHPDGRLTFVSNRDGAFEIYIESNQLEPK
jgi:TolB protein